MGGSHMIHFYGEAQKKKDELVKLLAQWVAIPSVYDQTTATEDAPFGTGIKEALQWFEDLGRKDGFVSKNIDDHAVYIEYGQGEEYIGVFGHGDVVPAGEGWKTDPYKLHIINDTAYGRGVVDDKGPVLCCYLALKIIKELNIQTKNRIRIVVGGNEESGFRCIRHYFSKEPHPKLGFTPDAKFPVIHGEKGGMTLEFKGEMDGENIEIMAGVSQNTIPSVIKVKMPSQYKYLQEPFYDFIAENNLGGTFEGSGEGVYMELIGIGGHSSKPDQARNPITKLMRFLTLNVSDVWVEALGKLIMDGNERGEKFSLSAVGKCGDLTIVPTMLRLSNGEFSIIFNMRYPENVMMECINQKIKKYIIENDLHQWEFKVENIKKPHYVDPSDDLVKKLHHIFIKHTGDTERKVRVTSAGTYASEMKNAVVFGAEFGDGSSGNVHGANEYMEIERLLQAMAIYTEAMIELSNM